MEGEIGKELQAIQKTFYCFSLFLFFRFFSLDKSLNYKISFFHFRSLLGKPSPGVSPLFKDTNGCWIIGTINCIRFVTIYKIFSPANASLIIFTQ